jgi:hypothetical protein
MGLLSILKKVRQMEREMRILMVYVPRHLPHTHALRGAAPAPVRARLPAFNSLPATVQRVHPWEEVSGRAFADERLRRS